MNYTYKYRCRRSTSYISKMHYEQYNIKYARQWSGDPEFNNYWSGLRVILARKKR